MFQEAALFRGLWGPGGRGVQYAVTVKRWGCMEARGSPGNGGALPTAFVLKPEQDYFFNFPNTLVATW